MSGPESWLGDIELEAGAAAIVAAGMKAVARADGHVHQRELALIGSFEAQLPKGEGPADALPAALHELYVRSLVMVALADGRITPVEEQVIEELAAGHGISSEAVAAVILAVKREFLQVFAGVHVFRDAVVAIAADLGLPESEVDALRAP
jgi:uncharacterized membrane protein YebE (DUF533 family)